MAVNFFYSEYFLRLFQENQIFLKIIKFKYYTNRKKIGQIWTEVLSKVLERAFRHFVSNLLIYRANNRRTMGVFGVLMPELKFKLNTVLFKISEALIVMKRFGWIKIDYNEFEAFLNVSNIKKYKKHIYIKLNRDFLTLELNIEGKTLLFIIITAYTCIWDAQLNLFLGLNFVNTNSSSQDTEQINIVFKIQFLYQNRSKTRFSIFFVLKTCDNVKNLFELLNVNFYSIELTDYKFRTMRCKRSKIEP